MQRLQITLMISLLAGWAGTSQAQPSNIALIAEADTCIREHSPTSSRGGNVLEVRSRDVSGSGRQHVAYIRFHLGQLGDAPEPNAVFSVSRSTAATGQTFAEGEVHVYGLLSLEGNTPQQWDEGLTYNASGLEIPGDGNAETQDLDTNRLQFIGDLPESLSPGTTETLSISNAALDTFLSDQFANGGYATLMLVQEDGVDRELYFENREVGVAPPTLNVVGELTGGGEDTTPPTVAVVAPASNSTNVDVGRDVLVRFSEPMDAATITSDTFILYDAMSNSVPGNVSYNPGTLAAILNPIRLLEANSTYTAAVVGGPSGVTDLATNALAEDYTWSFTTGEAPEVDPFAPISLGPDADTYLTNDEKNGPDDNHGGKSLVEVRWHPVRVHIGYVRYDISLVPPSLYSSATLKGTFSGGSYNGPGTWNVYGLDDNAAADNWNEGAINYATAGGVDPSAPINSFGITNATLLGTITLDGVDEQPLPFASNPQDLDLTAFLEADTDGSVTFIIMSETQDEVEYRIDSKEGNSSDGHGPMTLNFAAPLAITDISLTTEPSVVLNWVGPSRHYYGVERSLDLAQSDWVAVASNLVANTYTDAAPTEVQAFYRVVDEGIRPPIEFFFDDFEAGVGDWSTRNGPTHQPGTDWQLGDPNWWGPWQASSGTNAWGTNLQGFYGPNADTSLLSPIIDLSAASTARLTFSNFFDFDDAGDTGSIYMRDSAGAEIPGLENPIATYEGFNAAWSEDSVNLPEAVLGQTIRLEFRFVSNDNLLELSGWYIDDVGVHE